MKLSYYDNDAEGELTNLKAVKGGLGASKSFLTNAGKVSFEIGPVGMPSDDEMKSLAKFIPDASMKAEEIFVFPVLMANDLPDRQMQRFDAETLREFVALPEHLSPVGKSLIVAHGPDLFNRDGSQIPEGRLYDVRVMEDANSTNPVTGKAPVWMVGRVYMARTAKNEADIQQIRAGVHGFVSVGLTVRGEFDPSTGKAWGGDYFESSDGTKRGMPVGIGVLRGAVEFIELSYKIALGAQYGAGVAGFQKNYTEEVMTKTIESKRLGKSFEVTENQADLISSAFESVEASLESAEAALETLESVIEELTGLDLDGDGDGQPVPPETEDGMTPGAEMTMSNKPVRAAEALRAFITTLQASAVEKTAQAAQSAEQLSALQLTLDNESDKLLASVAENAAKDALNIELSAQVGVLSDFKAEVDSLKSALSVTLENGLVALGETEEDAKLQSETYSAKGLEALRTRIERVEALKKARFAAGQQSVVGVGDENDKPKEFNHDADKVRQARSNKFAAMLGGKKEE